jgi:hypothetical protein
LLVVMPWGGLHPWRCLWVGHLLLSGVPLHLWLALRGTLSLERRIGMSRVRPRDISALPLLLFLLRLRRFWDGKQVDRAEEAEVLDRAVMGEGAGRPRRQIRTRRQI